ncbi:superoxide dismutase family protein [Montanilutibacter psychrotolerans]|uniref:Superoxide dismutase [Cu-Zn] n=1 Tax=Montanilutibacter psychrotolerans TaxID=1327343 RepID=A0A3M8SRD7_9GAMM|nr:superoxide dismutase family protein [Lysobacter psychrotolerans]RNF83898.1 superoxide dismutase family protein [Lysobacter psychrotolerans]
MLATACGSAPSRPTSADYRAASVSTAQLASATVAPASGSLVSGKLSLTPMTGGVRVSGELGGLGRGSTHAIHIHEKGDCSAADASSAGAHFNPAAATHGKVGGGAHHAGDMDNIVASADGVARVDVHAEGVTLGGGAANDIAGRALVVHAAPDDYSSQPAGNAGARVACAVITIQQ